MSEETTQNLPDSRSFEERVFARFDVMDRLEARILENRADVRDLESRVVMLEGKQA